MAVWIALCVLLHFNRVSGFYVDTNEVEGLVDSGGYYDQDKIDSYNKRDGFYYDTGEIEKRDGFYDDTERDIEKRLDGLYEDINDIEKRDGYYDDTNDIEKRGYEGTEPHGYSEADSYIDVIKRYLRPNRGWGHRSRYPWKRLPDRLCYQHKCKRNKDCCMRHNICDKSAKVCRDCWYGSMCKTEENCCHAFPYCLRRYVRDPRRKGKYIKEGKCVDALTQLKTFQGR